MSPSFAPVLLCLSLLGAPVAVAVQDPLVQQALGRIEKYEKLEPELKPGDVETANYYLNQIGWAAKRLNATSDKNDAHWKDAAARYEALKKKIEAKAGAKPKPATGGYDVDALVQLNKEIGAAFENLKLLEVKHLADEIRAKGFRKQIAEFEGRLEDFPKDDSNVQIVAGNLDSFRTVFQAGVDQLKAGQTGAAEVSKGIESLRQKYRTESQPSALAYPFDEDRLRVWAAEMRRWREQEIPGDLRWLREASGNPVADRNAIGSLMSWLQGSWSRRLDEVEKQVRERIASDVQEGLRGAEWILATDPGDRNHVLGRILGKGRLDENMARLRDGELAVQLARVYDEAMGAPAVLGPTVHDPAQRPAQPDRDGQAETLARAVDHLKQAARQALDQVRLPKPASTSEELLEVAAETLKNPRYEVGDWERLVINTDKTRKVSREAWIRGDAVGATVSYYKYEWEEFQVTTAERVGEEIWLYANTLKRYESGDPTTPVGRWILSRRFELTPILAENLEE